MFEFVMIYVFLKKKMIIVFNFPNYFDIIYVII